MEGKNAIWGDFVNVAKQGMHILNTEAPSLLQMQCEKRAIFQR